VIPPEIAHWVIIGLLVAVFIYGVWLLIDL